ncbi:tetratricopeptide repeat protein [Oxynema sp. CENA135]|uniref:class I SAM-dependent methyltransferase n=1 Tax=Oxynema sp. CENA135 TaxID=984206 RepID=UPI00190A6ED5|nr:class I SAM-dependent methyltransferase [Oxynema sp. CENA135]MBK4729187.1 tetratricopeptide repeat protein [Oxynema sp. CENA135]
MDYQKFITQLPTLYEDWGTDTVKPKSPRFDRVLEQVESMTTTTVMQLLNFAVECMEEGEYYCEIGTYQGSTLIGALLDRDDRPAYAVDNFSELDDPGETLDLLQQNLNQFNLKDRVIFQNQDFEEFLLELPQEINGRIGVYFYDCAYDYRSQLVGLLLIKSILADRALIVLNNSNWKTVQQAQKDFVAAHPQCQVLLELSASGAAYPSFGNGILILSWDASRSDRPSSAKARQQMTPAALRSLYPLDELARHQGDLQRLYQEAIRCQQQQDLDLAQVKYREYLLWHPEAVDAWLNLAEVARQKGDNLEAIAALLKALEQQGTRSSIHDRLGQLLEQLDRLPRAIAAYRKAIELDANALETYDRLGQLLKKMGDLEGAEKCYRQAIATHPKTAEIYLYFGQFLTQTDRIEEAISIYKQAVRLAPHKRECLEKLESAIARRESRQNS